MADEIKTGGEVDAYCTKCKMILAHTVLAVADGKIARVRCNTCMGEHAYKAKAPGTKTAKPKKPKKSDVKRFEKPVHDSFEVLKNGKDLSKARKYTVKEKFAAGDVVDHPTFGIGIVAAIRGPEKMDVAFESGTKTLMHAKGSMPAMTKPLPRRTAAPVEEGEAEVVPADAGAAPAGDGGTGAPTV